MARLKTGSYPTQPEQIETEDWGTVSHPKEMRGRVALPEFCIVADFVAGGSGYGDPLDREPERVARDVRVGIVSPHVANEVYGVVLRREHCLPDGEATEKRRREIRENRWCEGKAGSGSTPGLSESVRGLAGWKEIRRFHECLAVMQRNTVQVIGCVRCGHLFCEAKDNYKRFAVRRTRDLLDLAHCAVPSGETYIGGYHEYCCPGCATLLQVDTFCSLLPASHEPLQDFEPAAGLIFF